MSILDRHRYRRGWKYLRIFSEYPSRWLRMTAEDQFGINGFKCDRQHFPAIEWFLEEDMNTQAYSLQHRGQRSLVGILIVIALITSSYVALPPQQGRSPVFVIEAPSRVEVGDRIEIQLIVDHAQDLAGYEAQLLFDTTAAHFSAFQQRDSDLKKFGRDIIPLEEGELPDGVAMGLASCPYQDCVQLKGNSQPRGANGKVRLGTVIIGTDQEGLLQLRFDHLKFVDASGNTISVNIPQSVISVQVGENTGVAFAAPSSNWQFSASAPTTTNFDVN